MSLFLCHILKRIFHHNKFEENELRTYLSDPCKAMNKYGFWVVFHKVHRNRHSLHCEIPLLRLLVFWAPNANNGL